MTNEKQNEKQEALKAGRNLTATIETNIRKEDADSKGDAAAKKIFSYKKILAVLLKLCVREYQDSTLEEICGCIETVREGSKEVSPGMEDERVRQENTESQPGSEKRTYFDILFDAQLPKSKQKRKYLLKIDLEIQKSLKLEYPIEYRGIYYLAREMSGQLDYVYEDTTEYKDLSKVVTIWLCLNDIPKYLQNTVIRHKMMVEEALGVDKEKAPQADLMEMIIVRLGGNLEEEKAPEVIKYLYGIFENAKYGKHFDKYITVEDVEKEPEIRKGLNDMTGVALLNYRDGESKGRLKGRLEGRIISLYYDANLSAEEIAQKVKCELSFVEEVLAGAEPIEV